MIVDNISTDTNVTRNGDQYVDSIQYFVKKEHTNFASRIQSWNQFENLTVYIL